MELSQVLQALRNADAAGDTEAAKRLAVIAQQLMSAQGGAPATKEQPQSGFTPALKAGFENLKGDTAALAGRVGLMDVDAAEKYRAERQAEAKALFKPTEEGWTEAPFKKIGELAAGSIPYMAAPVVAGGAAAVFGAPALVGAGAAGLASAAQFTGSNLGRQMEEGKALRDTNLGYAAAAAVPQAALDMLGLKMIPGIRRLFAEAGEKLTVEAAKQIAEQGVKTVLKDYGTTALKTMGAEGLTEAGQQVFERLQAGLNITDPAARKEYLDNFIGGAVLGGVMSPAGRYVERGQQQKEADAVLGADRQKALIAERDKQEADKTALDQQRQTPEFAEQVAQDYDDAKQKFEALKAQIVRPPKGTALDPVDAARNKELGPQLKEAKVTLDTLATERLRVQPILQQVEAQKALAEQARYQEAEAQAQREIPQETQANAYYQAPQGTLPGVQPMAAEAQSQPVNEAQERETLLQQHRALGDYLDTKHQQDESDAAAAADIGKLQALFARRKEMEQARKDAATRLKQLGVPLEDTDTVQRAVAELAAAQEQLRSMAGAGFDPAKAQKLVTKIGDLQDTIDKHPEIAKQLTFGTDTYQRGGASHRYCPGPDTSRHRTQTTKALTR